MLSMSSGTLESGIRHRLQNFDLGAIVLRVASDLAKCAKQDVDKVIKQSIADIAASTHMEQVGWFLLTESGTLTDVFSPAVASSESFALSGGLQKLPWCTRQLQAGRAVLVYDTDNLFPAAEIDQQTLKAANIRSVAFLPSQSVSLGLTVLVLSSNSTDTEWSNELVESCTLLENIFSNAFQRGKTIDSQMHIDSFQQLFTTSEIPMAILSFEGVVISSNIAMKGLLGYSEEDLASMAFDSFVILPKSDQGALFKGSMTYLIARRLSKIMLLRKDRSLLAAKVKVSLIGGSPVDDSRLLLTVEEPTEKSTEEMGSVKRQGELADLASLLIQSQEEERKRLSRELHDDIGQRLSLAASSVAVLASQQSLASSDALQDLRNELDSLCTDVHEMSHDMHSYKLMHLGLKCALKDLCQRLSRKGFEVEFCAEDFEDPIPKDIALCLYRVVQEALNNTVKHSKAKEVAVIITKLQGVFYLTIQDSGVGFDQTIRAAGLGFVSMRERIKLVDGDLRMNSIPGRGTEIWVAVPDLPEQKLVAPAYSRGGTLPN